MMVGGAVPQMVSAWAMSAAMSCRKKLLAEWSVRLRVVLVFSRTTDAVLSSG